MKKVEFSMIYKSFKTNRYTETTYMPEHKIIELIKCARKEGVEILGINRREVAEDFICYKDMIKYGYMD